MICLHICPISPLLQVLSQNQSKKYIQVHFKYQILLPRHFTHGTYTQNRSSLSATLQCHVLTHAILLLTAQIFIANLYSFSFKFFAGAEDFIGVPLQMYKMMIIKSYHFIYVIRLFWIIVRPHKSSDDCYISIYTIH